MVLAENSAVCYNILPAIIQDARGIVNMVHYGPMIQCMRSAPKYNATILRPKRFTFPVFYPVIFCQCLCIHMAIESTACIQTGLSVL